MWLIVLLVCILTVIAPRQPLALYAKLLDNCVRFLVSLVLTKVGLFPLRSYIMLIDILVVFVHHPLYRQA